MTDLQINEIVSDPAIRGGRPVLRGTGFRVSDVVVNKVHNGLSAEEIAEQFSLDLAQVYAALAYYYLHQDDIDAQIQRDRELAEEYVAELQKQGKLKGVE